MGYIVVWLIAVGARLSPAPAWALWHDGRRRPDHPAPQPEAALGGVDAVAGDVER